MARRTSNKAFNLGTIRTVRGTLKRFVALAVICTLGATMLVGLRASCLDLRHSADEYFDAQNLFDVRVQSTLGLTDDDVDALAGIEGVSAAEGGWSETVYASVGSGSEKVEVRALSNKDLNEPLVLEGELPANSDEIAVTRRYAQESGLGLGDTVSFHSEADSSAGDATDGDAARVGDEGSTSDEDDSIDVDMDVDTDADAADTTVFTRKDYKISAIVLDPQDVNAGEGTMSFRSSGGAQYAFFVTDDNVETDVYTVVYLAVDGAEAPLCYSDEYEDLVDAVKQRVEDVREERQAARGQGIRDDAYATIADAEATASQKIADGQQEIDDARAELEDGAQQLADGKAELEEQETTANEQLDDAQAQIDDGWAQLESGTAELDSNEAQLASGIAQIKDGIEQARAARDPQIAAAKQKVEDAVSEQFSQARDEADQNIAALEKAIAELEAAAGSDEGAAPTTSEESPSGSDAASSGDAASRLAELKAQLEAAKTARDQQLSDAAESAAKAQAWAEQGQAVTQQVDDAIAQTVAGLDSQLADLESKYDQVAAARQTLADSAETLTTSQETLDENRASAEQQIADGRQTLAESEAELADGASELADAQTTLDSKSAEAAEKIADARAKVADVGDPTWYVQGRSALSSYASVESDASCIEVLGTVLPIVFFVVAVLISLTTMTRMVEEERGLIGLYKALGYSRGRILSKYVSYAGAACLVGGLIGDFCGFVILPAIIFTIFSTMYALPAFTYHLDVVYAVAAIVLFAAGIVGATIATCVSELREAPASLMRPKAPKAGSRILLERIRPIWSRMGFLNKVTARNIFRYKRRFFMTVFGIAGCVALLICGFGIRDTVLSLSDRQYGDAGVQRHDLMAVCNADDLDAVAADLGRDSGVGDLQRLRIDSLTASFGGSSESVTLFVVPDGCDLSAYVGLADDSGETLSVGSAGCLITKNAEQVLGFAAGDTIHVQDATLAEADVQVEGIAMNYLGNFIYMSESAYEASFGVAPEQNGLLATLSGDDAAQIEFCDGLSSDSRLLSVTSTAKLVRDFSSAFTLINTVVYVVIVLAAALAFTVVFTLSNTNISERERELATIKVLGFLRPEVHVYINKETLILTGIGILVGLPCGYLLTRSLTYVLKMPSLYFDTIVAWPTYLIAGVLAFAFTLMVNGMTNRSLDRIDMVGALKSAE